MQLPPAIRYLAGVSAIIAAVLLLRLVDLDLSNQRLAARDKLAPVTYDLPPPSFLPVLSFGYNELAADMIWIQTISYFAEQLFKKQDLRYLRRYADCALTLDNRFKAVYRYTPSMYMTLGHKLSNRDVRYAIDLLKRGYKQWPDDWKFPLNIGTYYMFELKKTCLQPTKLCAKKNKKQKQAWKRIGADWIREAALIGADIPWLPSLAAKVYSEQGQRDLAIRHLKEIYLATKDERMRRDIRFKLRQLQAEQILSEVDAAAKEQARAFKASPINFISQDLFVLVRQEPYKPFSLESLVDAR